MALINKRFFNNDIISYKCARSQTFMTKCIAKGGEKMQDIRNKTDKLVCRVDVANKVVEIVSKGCKTVIYFFDDGNFKVINTMA